jgi:hypothetical protein
MSDEVIEFCNAIEETGERNGEKSTQIDTSNARTASDYIIDSADSTT